MLGEGLVLGIPPKPKGYVGVGGAASAAYSECRGLVSRNRHTSGGRVGGHADIARSGPRSRRINEVSLSGGFREDLLGHESLDDDDRAAAKWACPGAAPRLRGSWG